MSESLSQPNLNTEYNNNSGDIPESVPPTNFQQNSAQEEPQEVQPQREIVRPSVTLLEWEAPERMFKTYPREFYRRIAIMILFFTLILIIIKEFLLILVLGIAFFVVYVFHTIPPRKVVHKITTNGVNFASEHLYKWADLDSFFIENKEGTDILIINTVDALPGRLFMLLDKKIDTSNLSQIMNERISIVEDPQPGALDKVVNKFSSKLGPIANSTS